MNTIIAICVHAGEYFALYFADKTPEDVKRIITKECTHKMSLTFLEQAQVNTIDELTEIRERTKQRAHSLGIKDIFAL